MRKDIGGRGLWAAALLLGALGSATAAAQGTSDDDLAVVKKAVRNEPPSAPVVEAGPAAAAGAPRPVANPRWLKVRVVERGGKGSKVTVRLPLEAAKALGDDLPLTIGGRREKLRLSEILRSLRAGEAIVEVKDEDSTVRVWVE